MQVWIETRWQNLTVRFLYMLNIITLSENGKCDFWGNYSISSKFALLLHTCMWFISQSKRGTTGICRIAVQSTLLVRFNVRRDRIRKQNIYIDSQFPNEFLVYMNARAFVRIYYRSVQVPNSILVSLRLSILTVLCYVYHFSHAVLASYYNIFINKELRHILTDLQRTRCEMLTSFVWTAEMTQRMIMQI